MKNPTEILVRQLAERFIKTSKKLVVAESCTGGSLAENLTRFPGSSSWFDCGFITYSNQSKQEILSVSIIFLVIVIFIVFPLNISFKDT